MVDRGGNLSRGKLGQGGWAYRVDTRALSLRWAGQFLRLDDVFARKQNARSRAQAVQCARAKHLAALYGGSGCVTFSVVCTSPWACFLSNLPCKAVRAALVV